MSKHYAGVFIHNFPKVMREIKMLIVKDMKYLKRSFDGTVESLKNNGQPKAPGGMAEEISSSQDGTVVSEVKGETPQKTMEREANSETGVQVLRSRLIVKESKASRSNPTDIHFRYFFLAEEVSGLPALDAPPRQVVETNASDGSTEKLVCYWMPLREFADQIFFGQREAFGAFMGEMALDEKTGRDFCKEFGDLVDRFPDPRSQASD